MPYGQDGVEETGVYGDRPLDDGGALPTMRAVQVTPIIGPEALQEAVGDGLGVDGQRQTVAGHGIGWPMLWPST